MNIDSIAGKKIDRRSFVAASAAATATLAGLSLVGCNENTLQETEAEAPDPGSLEEGAEWIAASCWHNCGGRCINKVLVKDGVVLRQKTDDSHEDSWDWPQNRGCLRGRAVQQQVLGADRIKYPMKRKHWEPLTGGDKELRGRDEWERIGWDEALDYIAAELKNAKEKYGNRSIFFQNIMGTEGYMAGLLGAFGGFVDVCATQSTGTFEYSNGYNCGGVDNNLNDRYDIRDNADYIIFWGNNPAWCEFGNPSYYIKHFKDAGAKFVFVGPDYNVSAGFTDAEWIPARPASDTALLLGVAHAMLARDENGSHIDWDFLDRCTVGFDAEHMPSDAKTDENFRDYLMGAYDGVEKTPEWASELSGASVDQINRLADILSCKNNCYISSNGAPARNKGAENYPQALMTVAAMGGHFGKPGNACGDDQFYSAFNRGPAIGKGSLSRLPFRMNIALNPVDDVLKHNEMWHSILEGKYVYTGHQAFGQYKEPEERDLDIHVMVCEQQNLLQSQSNINEGIKAFRKVDFIVSSAYTMKTDARYADIVLPITTRWETAKDAFYYAAGMSDKENVFGYRKVIDPLFESQSDYWVAEQLAERLGVNWSEVCPYTEDELWFYMFADAQVLDEKGEYKTLITITQDDIDRYGIRDAVPQEGIVELEKFLDDGGYRVKRSEGDAYVYIAYQAFREDPEANPLNTPSGKFEIYCQAKADMFATVNSFYDRHVEVSALPKFLEQHEGYKDSFIDWENKVRGPYPFQMTHVHYLRRAHTDMDNLPWVREAMTNPVFINKEDAAAKGIEDGDVILVHNDNGSFIRPATVSRTVMPGVILVPHGAAARIDEESGIDIAGADNILTSSCKETSSGLNGWNTTLVDYEKYTGDIELLPDCDWPLDIPLPDEE